MNPQLILTILNGTNLLGTLGPIGIELAMKIKALMTTDPNVTVTIQQLEDKTLRAADETLLLIDEWNRNHPR